MEYVHVKESRALGGFFVFMMVVLLAAIALVMFTPTVETKHVEPLSINQQQQLVQVLTLKGYKHLLKNGCYSSMVKKIQTGVWDDVSCASTYVEYNIKGIK